MQPALQMSSSQVVPTKASSRKKAIWNQPDLNVRLTGQNLVEMFLALSSSLITDGNVFALTEPEQIPAAVKFHSYCADTYREAGDIDQYFRHCQLAALLKKVEFPLFEEACINAAMEKWFAAEEGCKEMNEKCWDILQHAHTNQHPELSALLIGLRREILSLLGPRPPSDEQLANSCGFGPGADSSHTRKEGHAAYKQLNHSALSPLDLDILDEVAPALMRTGGHPGLALCGVTQTVCASFQEARLEFVPKSCVEHRTIEIMPSLTTFRAKGLDAHIRKRLREHWNIDLRDQGPNRHLAFLGSLRDDDTSPVTLDLSSASDRISMGLIRLIFPIEWCKALFGVRAKTVRLPDGSSVELQKFSSMGNSVTFSLQTAIYSAIIVRAYRAAGLGWKPWRAYGDDLIVIKKVAPRVISDLELVGFKLNLDKSFISGPFRESCGHDYFSGQNVRPFYIKKPIRTVADIYKYVNVMQMIAVRSPISVSSYRGLIHYLLKLIPREFFFVGSPAFGVEACLWSPYEVAPKGIIREREVTIRVPETLALRVALLNGAGDSAVRLRKVRRKIVDLRKEPRIWTPSILKKWIAESRLLESAAAVETVALRDVRDVPTGISVLLVRRPGRPGLSPLSDNEISQLLDPVLAR